MDLYSALSLHNRSSNLNSSEKFRERKQMSGEGKVVCVTRASGYIASWLIKLLLEHGYTVKATVHDPNDPKKTQHLLALDGAKEILDIFKASFSEEGSFASAIDGCDGVFHTASPVVFSTNVPQVDIGDAAVNGTLNVLKSCAKVASVKRVVFTSSMTAVMHTGKPLTPHTVIDETWFSDPAICDSLKVFEMNWYVLSKILAEDAAWKFAQENGIDLVVINLGLVIGPLLQPTLNLSLEIVLNLIVNGDRTFPCPYRFVDLRDVAYAHIRAFEVPAARGSYCVVGRVTTCAETLNISHERFPTLQLPGKGRFDDGKPYEATYQVSREKAESLGIDFISWEASLEETIESLKEKGFLSF
ncbi:hypothetical protein LWI28_010342 [Acer negundo]|uniref:NAD-dependent epimerase/dehydratase domain-containing protein n=1 Tax=Acer negundo TaxID=4023 RepID=A0AAD5IMI0_ACENE|nr:hypothetical protein LWI28_010342 [Acer negundo]